MKSHAILPIFLLLATMPAFAQQTAIETDSGVVRVERVVVPRPKPPILSPEDSARERARQANVQYLREYGVNSSLKPPQPLPSGATDGVAEPKKPNEMISQEEAAERARIREEQARKMHHDDKFKDQSKRASKELNSLRKAGVEPEATEEEKPKKDKPKKKK